MDQSLDGADNGSFAVPLPFESFSSGFVVIAIGSDKLSKSRTGEGEMNA
jgi:hypothetical protein